MEKWLKISIILCVFGFFKQMRPSESYAYNFLVGPWRNFTDTQISQEAFPIGTYSYLVTLVAVFLITDLLRYKPIIILSGATSSIACALMIWTSTMVCLIVSQIFYGIFMATEVAYYAYIYAKVDKEHYQKVTSHTRAAILAGRTISGALSQILISFKLLNFFELMYLTLGSEITGTLWCFFIPPVNKSIYFHQENHKPLTFKEKLSTANDLMKTHLIHAYSNGYVVKWSVWWALATCGSIQTDLYIQTLYEAVDPSDEFLYNGAVEAILTLLGFSGAMLAGFIKINWQEKGEIILALCSLIQGGFLMIAARTDSIFVCYSFYILFGFFFNFMITIASTQIALFIDEDSYGLVFGINTFLALLFSTLLALIIVEKNVGFSMKPKDQYFSYGCYHVIISVLFLIIGFTSCIRQRQQLKV